MDKHIPITEKELKQMEIDSAPPELSPYLTRLIADLRAAREALSNYGTHFNSCVYRLGDGECNCGLKAALPPDAKEPAPQEPEAGE